VVPANAGQAAKKATNPRPKPSKRLKEEGLHSTASLERKIVVPLRRRVAANPCPPVEPSSPRIHPARVPKHLFLDLGQGVSKGRHSTKGLYRASVLCSFFEPPEQENWARSAGASAPRPSSAAHPAWPQSCGRVASGSMPASLCFMMAAALLLAVVSANGVYEKGSDVVLYANKVRTR
jgi:hypothetical protein